MSTSLRVITHLTPGVIDWLDTNKEEGVFNCSAPEPVSNRQFMESVRKATRHHFGLPAYKWMLEIGAKLIGTEPELILKSRWVLPTRLLKSGFSFKYNVLDVALNNIVQQIPRRSYHLF